MLQVEPLLGSGEFHFRLAESQFFRMCGAHGAAFTVTKVTCARFSSFDSADRQLALGAADVVNPMLVNRYEKFRQKLLDEQKSVKEHLTFQCAWLQICVPFALNAGVGSQRH